MFKKRVVRNLRQKRDEDSDDDETGAAVAGRGIANNTGTGIFSDFEKPSTTNNNNKATVPVTVTQDEENSASSDLSRSVTPIDAATIGQSFGPEKSIGGPKRVSSFSGPLLSFGDDENETEEMFQVKKSSHSRKLEKMRQRMKAESGKIRNLEASGGGLSTAETKNPAPQSSAALFATSKKKKTNENLSTTPAKSQEKKKVTTASGTIVLTGKDAEAADLAVEDAEDFRKKLSSNEIPDAKFIHMARKQRQFARDASEFLPVRVEDTQKYHTEKSRLIREDDDNDENSDSGEEGGQFYSKLRNDNETERRKVESDFLNTEQASDEDNDDEFDKWEQEQIRKGVSAQQITSYKQEQMAASAFYYSQTAAMFPGYFDPAAAAAYQQQQHYFQQRSTTHVISLDSPETRSPGPAPPLINQAHVEIKDPQPMDLDIELPGDESELNAALDTIGPNVQQQKTSATGTTISRALPKIGGGDVGNEKTSSKARSNFSVLRSRIKERFDENENLIRALSLDLEKTRQHITENVQSIEKIESSTPNLRKQFQFYQEIRSYVRDLLDCFDEKVILIEKLEQRMLTLFSNRATFIIRRRQDDVKDQFDEISLASLGKSALKPDPDRMMRAAEREARRTRRRQARERSLANLTHHDGMSSDEEEAPSRIANFLSENEKVQTEAAQIFDDVIDDFCSLQKIMHRFQTWKQDDFDAYDQAFVDMCLPKLFSPLIRLELLTWNLAEPSCLTLEKMNWYQTLLKFKDRQSSVAAAVEKNGPSSTSSSLIASVIEKVICPKVKDFVEKIWNPTSTTESQRLTLFLKTIATNFTALNFLDETNEKVKNLRGVIYKRIKLSLDEDLFTPIYSKEIIENKSTGAVTFLDRQFWLALKFVNNLLLWENVLPIGTVQELTLDGVLNRHLVLNLQCSPPTEPSTLLKCKSICNTFPSSWFSLLSKKSGGGESSTSQFEPLHKVMSKICEQIKDSKSLDKHEANDMIRDICRLLKKMGESKYSKKIVEKYKIKL